MSILKLNHLCAPNVVAVANLLEQFFAGRAIEIQHRERGAAGLISTERHRCDVHAMLPKQGPDATDHAGAIGIFEDDNNTMRPRFHRSGINANDSWSNSKECAADRQVFSLRAG